MHRVAWSLQNSQAIGQKCEKPCLVFQHGLQKANGEDRSRTFRCFPNVSGMFEGYLLTLAYADNKPVAVARLGEYLDFKGLERDYKSIRSAEIARINCVLTPHAT